MKATIKGLEKVEYVSKKTGLPVNGVTFHVERKDASVVGACVEQIFMNTQFLTNLGFPLPPEKFGENVGKTVEVEYNNRGFIVNFEISK